MMPIQFKQIKLSQWLHAKDKNICPVVDAVVIWATL